MKRTIVPSLLAIAFLASGCYHTTFVTGKAPSNVVVENPWATSLIAGLVPPEEVDVSQSCPNGVAKVESRRSFLNMIASAITLDIYSPMHLKVTCAAGGMATTDGVDAPVVDALAVDTLAVDAPAVASTQ